ncbi:hypothetical protein PR048_023081 [Dryococelus australis]|uniref:Uncharacterized protein n=1 Tax=Dryococelus australis TaxID=614101 RepID=A0ABQ9GT26_9NEOP|nr:hypothetical protein PR048_023081 [Dryococelus australis]
MSGQFKGCAAIIAKSHPQALYHHCSSHALNLVLSRACTVPAIRNTLATVKELISFFRQSAKRGDVSKQHVYRLNENAKITPFKSKKCDLASLVKHAESLQEEVQHMRDEAADTFRTLYSEAQVIAEVMGMTIEVPRPCSRPANKTT